MKFSTVFLICLAFFSCSEKKVVIPAEAVPPDTMKMIMTDLHLAQSSIAVHTIADTSSYSMAEFQNYILEKHNIEKERFIKSLKFYTAHPQLMKAIYDSVLIDLTKIQAGSN